MCVVAGHTTSDLVAGPINKIIEFRVPIQHITPVRLQWIYIYVTKCFGARSKFQYWTASVDKNRANKTIINTHTYQQHRNEQIKFIELNLWLGLAAVGQRTIEQSNCRNCIELVSSFHMVHCLIAFKRGKKTCPRTISSCVCVWMWMHFWVKELNTVR